MKVLVEGNSIETGAASLRYAQAASAKTVSEATYNRLKEDIVSGLLPPGAKLRFAGLHKSYNVGTGTLREALSRLTSEQLVVAEGQKGFRVAPVSKSDLWDMTHLLSQVEAQAIESAIRNLDMEGETSIVAAFHRLSRFGEEAQSPKYLNTPEGARLHREFHMSLLACCTSSWLLKVVTLLYDHSERYRRMLAAHSGAGRDSSVEHREIMEATIARDSVAAQRLLKQHIVRTADLLSQSEAGWSMAPTDVTE